MSSNCPTGSAALLAAYAAMKAAAYAVYAADVGKECAAQARIIRKYLAEETTHESR